ncbi:hypothetical protein U1Q18_012517 [Sarracenia purpurea var. burkii]
MLDEGPQLPKKIRAIASYRDYTFAAYGNAIGVFKRSHQHLLYHLIKHHLLPSFFVSHNSLELAPETTMA